jgi:transglutaminase-like putative cysteine protease
VIYSLRHLTTYLYEKPVTYARCALRLTPRKASDQRVLSSSLRITPVPTRLEKHIGQFGEPVVTAIIETPHRELRILARSQVDVTRPARGLPLAGEPWERIREKGFAIADLGLGSPAHFLFPTAMTATHPAMTAYAATSFTPGRPVIEAALDLAARIKADFTYDSGSTDVRTLAIEAFEARHGVCQDFAQIMIAGLRGLGLPAAYVSGYLRTYPAPGRPRLEGVDATHAWTDLWCGPQDGWIGFDPTNALVVSDEHIVLAIGRDYSDVAPIGGVVLGSGDQTIKVGVDVVPMDGTPQQSAGRVSQSASL